MSALRIVPRLRPSEPLSWPEARRLASCRLAWRACRLDSAREAARRREKRRDLWVFWSLVGVMGLGWAGAAGLYLANLLGWFR